MMYIKTLKNSAFLIPALFVGGFVVANEQYSYHPEVGEQRSDPYYEEPAERSSSGYYEEYLREQERRRRTYDPKASERSSGRPSRNVLYDGYNYSRNSKKNRLDSLLTHNYFAVGVRALESTYTGPNAQENANPYSYQSSLLYGNAYGELSLGLGQTIILKIGRESHEQQYREDIYENKVDLVGLPRDIPIEYALVRETQEVTYASVGLAFRLNDYTTMRFSSGERAYQEDSALGYSPYQPGDPREGTQIKVSYNEWEIRSVLRSLPSVEVWQLFSDYEGDGGLRVEFGLRFHLTQNINFGFAVGARDDFTVSIPLSHASLHWEDNADSRFEIRFNF